MGKNTIMRPDRDRGAAAGGTTGSRAAATRDAGWCLQSLGNPSYNLLQILDQLPPGGKHGSQENRQGPPQAGSEEAPHASPHPPSKGLMACRPSPREMRRRVVRFGMTRTASRRRDPIRPDAFRVSLPRLWRGVVLLGSRRQSVAIRLTPARRCLRCVQIPGTVQRRDAFQW